MKAHFHSRQRSQATSRLSRSSCDGPAADQAAGPEENAEAEFHAHIFDVKPPQGRGSSQARRVNVNKEFAEPYPEQVRSFGFAVCYFHFPTCTNCDFSCIAHSPCFRDGLSWVEPGAIGETYSGVPYLEEWTRSLTCARKTWIFSLPIVV